MRVHTLLITILLTIFSIFTFTLDGDSSKKGKTQTDGPLTGYARKWEKRSYLHTRARIRAANWSVGGGYVAYAKSGDLIDEQCHDYYNGGVSDSVSSKKRGATKEDSEASCFISGHDRYDKYYQVSLEDD